MSSKNFSTFFSCFFCWPWVVSSNAYISQVFTWRLQGNSLEVSRKDSQGISPHCYIVPSILDFSAFVNFILYSFSSRRMLGWVWSPLSCSVNWACLISFSQESLFCASWCLKSSRKYHFIYFVLHFICLEWNGKSDLPFTSKLEVDIYCFNFSMAQKILWS